VGKQDRPELALRKKRRSKALRRGFISVGSVCPAFPEISRTTSSDCRGR
jgi:hypothetical protein